MRRFWITTLLLIAGLGLAVAAGAITLEPGGGVTGGGARGSASNLRISGVIDGWSAGISEAPGGMRLQTGSVAALAPPPPNAAGREWLKKRD